MGIFTFSNPFEAMSAEGQSDFFVTASCFPMIRDLLEFYSADIPKDSDLENYCIGKESGCYNSFLASVSGLRVLVEILHELGPDQDFEPLHSAPERPSRLINKPGEYPSMQCRMDTLKYGLEANPERPECWFPSSI